MPAHPSRLLAGLLLLLAGGVVAVGALAVALARLLVDGGMATRPADAVLLGDLVAVLPFIVAFAVVNVAAAVGLLLGRSWGDGLGVGAATVGATAGTLGLLLVGVGRDPFAPAATARATADGIGILAAATVLYLLVIVAIAVAGRSRTIHQGAAA
jgi:hypothetical protein